ncbi:MAG: hypothetical protein MUF71_15650 [Candidatus Kapabacteria bacterium]|jgi:hypothetical protein|nr:hypothetical protein [Candidatus Kapabacteria bacterium]
MIQSLFCVVVIAFLFHPLLRSAQKDSLEAASEAPRVGIGVSILPYTFPNNDTYLVQPAGVHSWYIPVQFGQHFRWETEFAFAQANDSLRLNLNNNTVPARHYRTSTFSRVGMGVYYTHPFDAETRVYTGVRSGVVVSAVRWETFLLDRVMPSPFVYLENIGSFWFGGVLGFEYRFARHFALGAEAHLASYTTGAMSSTNPPPSDYPVRFPAGRTSDAVLTSANVALRFFF